MNKISIAELLASNLAKFDQQVDPLIRNDLQMIISEVLDVDRTYLYLNDDKILEPYQIQEIEAKILRLLNGEPLAYILGYKYFWQQKLFVTKDTLIPRADTEILVESVLGSIADKSAKLRILDLGTGSGAIAIALASELPNSSVVATDISDKALKIAKKNTKENNVTSIEFIQGNWYQNLDNMSFDIIVSNPPYIDQNDDSIDIEVKNHEPSSALFAKDNGLADIKIIISQAKDFLQENGCIYIEHGFRQAQSVRDIFKLYNFENISTIRDLNNKDRCTYASIV